MQEACEITWRWTIYNQKLHTCRASNSIHTNKISNNLQGLLALDFWVIALLRLHNQKMEEDED